MYQQVTAKQTVVHPYDGILLGNKRNDLIHATTWLNLKVMMLSERSQIKKEYIP